MKVAIYVEGITEAAFVYQLIKEYYQSDWTAFRLECLNLDPQEAAKDLRNYGDETASDYYLIYDSCSDTSVSSDIKNRINSHLEAGFDKVVGLRDVYSETYKSLYPQQFNETSVTTFIQDITEALAIYDKGGLIRLRFAIMEIEAWLLAVDGLFQRIDPRVDVKWLQDKTKIDIEKDPEKEYFHPYSHLENIYKSISRIYGKHWDAIKELIFKLTQTDFDTLYQSGKCNSFRDFHDAIFK